MQKETIARITEVVEAHQGRGGVFWDGPYTPEEAAQIVRLTAAELVTFGGFSASHRSEKFYVCFQYYVMDGFTDHGSEHASGYVPVGIFVVSPESNADWFEIRGTLKP